MTDLTERLIALRPFAEHAPWLEPDKEEAASIREIGLDPAEGIPDLSPKADPPTLADWRRARAALHPGVSEGATDSAGVAPLLPVERSAENPGHGSNQPDRSLADPEPAIPCEAIEKDTEEGSDG